MCSRQSEPSRSISGRRAGLVLAILGGVTALAGAQAPSAPPPSGESFDVTHYEVSLALHVDAGAVSGRERIDLVLRENAGSLVFDSGGLIVDSVTSGPRLRSGQGALPFVQRAQRLIVTLPAGARAGERRRIDISYHGTPRTGLTMLATGAQAYTTFSTSHWMIAVNARRMG